MVFQFKNLYKFKNIILTNSLPLGQNPKFTNKKLTQYIYGTKNKVEFFRINELQYIMLRLYPFMKSLFKNYSHNPLRFNRKFPKRVYPSSLPHIQAPVKDNGLLQKQLQSIIRKPLPYYKPFRVKVPSVQILFATTTSSYVEIIKLAAQRCHMPFHTGR
jgi:hypothetical protein